MLRKNYWIMRDFTLEIYSQLLESLLGKGYRFATFDEYVKSQTSDVKSKKAEVRDQTLRQAEDDRTQSAMPLPLCILRHDVDKLPENSLAAARLENELGINGTYYFRIVPESFDERIIKEIASLGHEIGYHYEEVDFAWRQVNGKWLMFNGKFNRKSKETSRQFAVGNRQNVNQERDSGSKSHKVAGRKTTDNQPPTSVIDLAYEMFKKNLEKIRSVAPVSTICMHGSPLSPFDNKIIWFNRDAVGSKYDYRELGLIGEPYFDIDWDVFGYLTDTGRRWNGDKVSVRDKVKSQMSNVKSELKSTQDIITALTKNELPEKLMITVHPQRWTNKTIPWSKELIFQKIKNAAKKIIVINDD